ncbi:helix-turn-helix transcriptional regulator [Sphingobacterium sp. ML3W]|uniref:helix-turn-helix transcriptional regulator n=1 Tax=Sphingobacterium sp. ML3W TaxID=1538644 RepID=UPI0009DCDB55|nr:AraC family transcriptional regulator [Sphingobacterium sp. ML3W]
MADHYQLLFHSQPIHTAHVMGKLPLWSKYKMSIAQSAVLQKFEDHSQILRQKLQYGPLFIELFQIEADHSFSFAYTTTQNRLFLFFLLEGRIAFSENGTSAISKANPHHFYVSHNRAGHYTVNSLQTESTIGLVVSIHPKWAKKAVAIYPNLHHAIIALLKSNTSYGIMPHCPIDIEVQKWIKKTLEIPNDNPFLFKNLLKAYIVQGLAYYEKLLIKTGAAYVYRVKLYIDKNYSDPDIDIKQFGEVAYMTTSSLQRKFKKEFGTTMYDYCTQVRLKQAYKLIHNDNVPKATVWFQVGYRDPSTFHKAYHKFFSKKG